MLIVVEGFDGSGKSTIAKKLADGLVKLHPDVNVHVLPDPGTTPVGLECRQMVLNNRDLSDYARFCLYNTSREAQYREVIIPLLAKGDIVITDRGVLSTYAYQILNMADEHCSHESLLGVAMMATHGITPDCVVFLDTSFEQCLDNAEARGDIPDAIESEPLDRKLGFHRNMRENVSEVYPSTPILMVQWERRLGIERMLDYITGLNKNIVM